MTARTIANEIVKRRDFQQKLYRLGPRRWGFFRKKLEIHPDMVTRVVMRVRADPEVVGDWERELEQEQPSKFALEQSYGIGWMVWIQLAIFIARLVINHFSDD